MVFAILSLTRMSVSDADAVRRSARCLLSVSTLRMPSAALAVPLKTRNFSLKARVVVPSLLSRLRSLRMTDLFSAWSRAKSIRRAMLLCPVSRGLLPSVAPSMYRVRLETPTHEFTIFSKWGTAFFFRAHRAKSMVSTAVWVGSRIHLCCLRWRLFAREYRHRDLSSSSSPTSRINGSRGNLSSQ